MLILYRRVLAQVCFQCKQNKYFGDWDIAKNQNCFIIKVLGLGVIFLKYLE